MFPALASDSCFFLTLSSWSENWGEDGTSCLVLFDVFGFPFFANNKFSFSFVSGYARIAQDPSKGPYGLYGIMLHGVVPDIAYNVTQQIFEDDPATTDLLWWHILLISIGGIFVLCCLFWTCAKICARRKE
jgi:hypothetical protein